MSFLTCSHKNIYTLHYDHLPIYCTCNLPITETRNVYKSTYVTWTVKDRWNKVDMLSYFHITGSLRYEISVPVHSFSCPIACNFISQHYNSIATSLCRVTVLEYHLNISNRFGPITSISWKRLVWNASLVLELLILLG